MARQVRRKDGLTDIRSIINRTIAQARAWDSTVKAINNDIISVGNKKFKIYFSDPEKKFFGNKGDLFVKEI